MMLNFIGDGNKLTMESTCPCVSATVFTIHIQNAKIIAEISVPFISFLAKITDLVLITIDNYSFKQDDFKIIVIGEPPALQLV